MIRYSTRIPQEWMKIQVLRYQTYILLIFSGFRGPKVTQRWRWYPAESSRKQEAVTFSWLLIEKYHMFDSIHPYPSYTIIPIERPRYSLRIYPKYELPPREPARAHNLLMSQINDMKRFAFTESLKDLDLLRISNFRSFRSVSDPCQPKSTWYCISPTTMSLLEEWWTTFELIIPWTIPLPRGTTLLVRQLILMEKCLNQNLHVEQAVVETVVETRRRIKLLTSTNYHSNNLVNLRLPMHKIVTTIDLTGIQMMIIMAYHPRFPPVMLRPTQSSQQQTQVSTIYIPGV